MELAPVDSLSVFFVIIFKWLDFKSQSANIWGKYKVRHKLACASTPTSRSEIYATEVKRIANYQELTPPHQRAS